MRTSAYKSTIYNLNDFVVDKYRRQVKLMNLDQKIREVNELEKPLISGAQKYVRRYRMTIRGRLGKNNRHAHLYAKGGELYRRCAQTIKLEHASRYDIYINSYWQRVK
jgi:hypothetical protein